MSERRGVSRSAKTGRNTGASPLIGFLAASLDEPYQYSVWSGASREAERLGATLLFFGGQRVGSPIGYEALDNIAYDLARRSGIVGLIVMANVIGTYLSREELAAFLKRFEGVTVVSVGVALDTVPSVHIQNEGGMRAVAEHLIQVHKRRKFLFLAGPTGHGESDLRRDEFIRSVAAFYPEGPSPSVLYADFLEAVAERAVTRFLADGNRPDAVVAANDLMALGAMSALSKAGLNVPHDVSVCGFDDSEDSRFSVPSLTTVRQQSKELGRLALRRVAVGLGLAAGEDKRTQAPISFIVRESCGCSGAALAERVELDDIDMPLDDRMDPLAVLLESVNRELARGRNPSGLRVRGLSPELLDRAALIVAEGELRYQANLRMAADRRAAVLREINSSLVSSFDLSDVLREVATGTRALGISACWLALFDKPGLPDWARLMLAAEGERLKIFAPSGPRFPTAELLPGGLPERWRSYICEPLRFGQERLGYLICTAGTIDRRVFEALRDQVSAAIKGAQLMAAERDRERRLTREVRVRTEELSNANASLLEEVERRKRLERELLEISNDIMGRIGRDIHDHLCQDIAGLGLQAALLQGLLRRSSETTAAAATAGEIAKAAGETAALAKGIARGLYPAELEAKGIVEAVAELVRAARRRGGMRIDLELNAEFEVDDSEKALQLYRIVQEALSNAVSHSKASTIKVVLSMDDTALRAEIRDDGIGMDKTAPMGKGMGLRIMKYRASVIGGELRIGSSKDGTVVSCQVTR